MWLIVGGGWLKVLAAGLMKFGVAVAFVSECSDGRHLVRVVPLNGEKAYSEWLCGDDYLEWVRCLPKVVGV
jgi:hypothetical protein